LRDSLTGVFNTPIRLFSEKRPEKAYAEDSEHIWALKDVSFDVAQGDVVGVIGRNGAGKSTLLKILCQITEPTEGNIRISGRVASMLEVGTGFHPELTGRENIFMNGGILGMTRAEIKGKFDEIMAFAEVEKFIDTPVKRYSSGMYVRLAFAVAAHLDPEILLVDEVLAVGDVAFQKKCLGKMNDVSKEGRTILFVSHNMAAINRLCRRAIFLDEGRLLKDGAAPSVVHDYLHWGRKTPAERVWEDINKAPGNDEVRLRSVRVCDEDGNVCENIDIRRTVRVDIEYWNLRPGKRLVPNLHFFNEEGACIFISVNSSDETWHNKPHPVGLFKSTCWIPGNFLSEGCITAQAAVSTVNPAVACACEPDAVTFQVVDYSEGDGSRGLFVKDFPGMIRPLLKWTMEHKPLKIEEIFQGADTIVAETAC